MIVNGREIKEKIVAELSVLAIEHPSKVCFVQFGNDAASTAFVKVKMSVAEQLGIAATVVQKISRRFTFSSFDLRKKGPGNSTSGAPWRSF